jgi:hypothetical protein
MIKPGYGLQELAPMLDLVPGQQALQSVVQVEGCGGKRAGKMVILRIVLFIVSAT